MASTIEPCPCEDKAPHPAPGKIEDSEQIIRLVANQAQVSGSDAAGYKLTQNNWRKSDFRERSRSASVLRACTAADDVQKRARAYTTCEEWIDDPLIAVATTLNVRDLTDQSDRRELCVNAEPVDDKLGDCPTHGGITRSEPGGGKKDQRTQMATLIDRLIDSFSVQRLSAFSSMSAQESAN